MGGLIKPVSGDDWPNLDGLKQDIVSGITGHSGFHQWQSQQSVRNYLET
jgi:hypothetical protein